MKVLQVNFKVAYVPLPPEMVEARKASLLLLLQWIKEDLILNPEGGKEEYIKEPSSPARDEGVLLRRHE
jgi:hypothetical protein